MWVKHHARTDSVVSLSPPQVECCQVTPYSRAVLLSIEGCHRMDTVELGVLRL